MPAWKSHGLTRTLSVIIYFHHHPSADVDDDDDDGMTEEEVEKENSACMKITWTDQDLISNNILSPSPKY